MGTKLILLDSLLQEIQTINMSKLVIILIMMVLLNHQAVVIKCNPAPECSVDSNGNEICIVCHEEPTSGQMFCEAIPTEQMNPCRRDCHLNSTHQKCITNNARYYSSLIKRCVADRTRRNCDKVLC